LLITFLSNHFLAFPAETGSIFFAKHGNRFYKNSGCVQPDQCTFCTALSFGSSRHRPQDPGRNYDSVMPNSAGRKVPPKRLTKKTAGRKNSSVQSFKDP
jgi:hypothetical protein